MLLQLYIVLPSLTSGKFKEEGNMFKISLRVARELSGYTVEKVANRCNITEDCYKKYEKDFGKAPAKIAFMIHSLFRISLDTIYIGK